VTRLNGSGPVTAGTVQAPESEVAGKRADLTRNPSPHQPRRATGDTRQITRAIADTPQPSAAWVCIRVSDIPPRPRSPELSIRVAELTARAKRLGTPPAYVSGNYIRPIGERLHPIRWTGRQWAVTSFGVERRDGTYSIHNDRLESIEWISHLASKRTVDLEDFAEALRIARRIKRRGICS
jgi:hypothetical protein